jgi:methionyl-tRNA formyltransferase
MHRMTRTVFMGSPEFAVPILRALASHYSILAAVTRPDRPSGRGRGLKMPEVKQAATEMGLNVLQPEKLSSPDVLARLRDIAPDLIVVAAFGQVLKPDILALPAHGCLNVHASLLPRWRGAAPIPACILAGDPETGVTILRMDPGLDTGPILAQDRIPIDPIETTASLTGKLALLGAELLIETLPAYLAGNLQSRPQESLGVTHAPMLHKDDGLLDFGLSATDLERRVRAFNPWPGAYLIWDHARLKVHRARPHAMAADIGKRLAIDHEPAVGSAGGLLVLQEVQPEGKRVMSGRDFLLGNRDWVQ